MSSDAFPQPNARPFPVRPYNRRMAKRVYHAILFIRRAQYIDQEANLPPGS